jgi:hypothetical protein
LGNPIAEQWKFWDVPGLIARRRRPAAPVRRQPGAPAVATRVIDSGVARRVRGGTTLVPWREVDRLLDDLPPRGMA